MVMVMVGGGGWEKGVGTNGGAKREGLGVYKGSVTS